jgi:hypothetical protein
MFAITLESPFPEKLNKKLSPVGEFLGRGEPDIYKGTREAGKIIY